MLLLFKVVHGLTHYLKLDKVLITNSSTKGYMDVLATLNPMKTDAYIQFGENFTAVSGQFLRTPVGNVTCTHSYSLPSLQPRAPTHLGQDGPAHVEAEQPAGDQPPLLRVHGVDEQEAAAGSPGLHLQLQLLHGGGRQDEHALRLHLHGATA